MTELQATAKKDEQASGGANPDLENWDGTQLHELRRARGLTLKELSLRSGLSIGLLSQLERGISAPSIRSLQAISGALQVTPSWFFSKRRSEDVPADEAEMIVRRGQGRLLTFNDHFRKELVTSDLAGALEGLLVTIEPGGQSGDKPYHHPGEELGFVVRGSLELWVDEKHYHLETGDTFRFVSTRPHRFANRGEEQAAVLWVITPPFY